MIFYYTKICNTILCDVRVYYTTMYNTILCYMILCYKQKTSMLNSLTEP